MSRDSIGEYRRAMRRRRDEWGPSTTRLITPPRQPTPPAPGEERRALRGSRALAVACGEDDLALAIRLLQRHNRPLRNRFGVQWYDVVAVVQAEAQRRGIAPSALARLLVSGLRVEEGRTRAEG